MPLCLSSRLALSAGLVSLGAAAIALPTSAAAAQSRAGCTSSHVPALSVTAARSPRVTGSVLVTAAGRRITVAASRRTHTSIAGTTWLEFCLHPRAVTRSVTLARVAPGGVSVTLARGGKLTFSGRRVAGTVASSTRAEFVQVLLDRRRSQASVYVNGGRRATVPASIPTAVQVYVGAGPATAAASGSALPVLSAAAQTPTAFAADAPRTTSTTSATKTSTTSAPAAAAGTTTTSAAAGITPAAASVVPANAFSPTSFWNSPLPSGAALDANSQTYVNDLVSQVKSYGSWMNTNTYSTPVYVVPADQPTVPVTLDTWGPDLQQEFDAVPIPSGAVSAAGTDESMTVWQPSTDRYWEFWLMHQVNGIWHARWGGEMDNTSTNPGYFQHVGQTSNWGATATGLPFLGGLITMADLQRGYINHALAISVPQTERSVFSWPAQRTDGTSTAATALPEGLRFRLDPSINVANLGLPWLDRMLAQAAQTYGIVIRDTSGCVSFYAQDPTPTGTNPWVAPFDGWGETTYLSWFPWSHLQALQTQLSG
jgi:hypothetical protein